MPPQVLIVDDDPDIRDTLAEVLAYERYTVLCAADGAQGLALLRAGARPDLILLDMLMPVVDGGEFLVQLRADPALAGLRVLVISASSTVRPPPDVPFMRKPLQLQPFVAAVARHAGPPADAPAPGAG
ncbi:MAG TPA: response regulator [Polyangia bacterium]|jgi:CheY-like chemotaxis protein